MGHIIEGETVEMRILRHMLTVRAPRGYLAVCAEKLLEELCERDWELTPDELRAIALSGHGSIVYPRIRGEIWQHHAQMTGERDPGFHPDWLNALPGAHLACPGVELFYKIRPPGRRGLA